MRIRVLTPLAVCLIVCVGCSLIKSPGQPSPQPPPTSHVSSPSAPTSSAPPTVPASSVPPTGPSSSVSAVSPSAAGSAAIDPVREFDGAVTADPEKFHGSVTSVGFSSPSGNIQCGFSDDAVTCQVSQYTYRPEPAHDCHGAGDWGGTVRLDKSDSATFTCAGDVEGGGPALAYGSQIVDGAVRCVSRQDGVTCENTKTSKGFRLASQAYLFFPSQNTDRAAVPQALVGQWSGHGRSLTIKASGAATLTYRAYRMCSDDPTPPCDKMEHNEIVDGGHLRLTLTSSSAVSEARGKIAASSDPHYRVGQSVTATLDNHQVLVRLGGSLFANFCDSTASARGDCGA